MCVHHMLGGSSSSSSSIGPDELVAVESIEWLRLVALEWRGSYDFMRPEASEAPHSGVSLVGWLDRVSEGLEASM